MEASLGKTFFLVDRGRRYEDLTFFFDSLLTLILQPLFKVPLSNTNGCHVILFSGLLLKVSLA